MAFEYPGGTFHHTFTWDPKAKTWTFLMEEKGTDGKCAASAEDKLQYPA